MRAIAFLLNHKITMESLTIPKDLFATPPQTALALFDFLSNQAFNNHKVTLESHVFSLLRTGIKRVSFAEENIEISDRQAIVMASGNCLMSEGLDEHQVFQSILLFFTHEKLSDFVLKYKVFEKFPRQKSNNTQPFFLIEKDAFLDSFIESIYVLSQQTQPSPLLLGIKFEELLCYLLEKYQDCFIAFIQNLLGNAKTISFRAVVESHLYSNLSIEEIAFLCNMSLSSFKRNFQEIYQESPGKWFQQKRLTRAKELLQQGKVKASDIYLEFGYESLSNFCAAFKQVFGVTPRQIKSIEPFS